MDSEYIFFFDSFNNYVTKYKTNLIKNIEHIFKLYNYEYNNLYNIPKHWQSRFYNEKIMR